ncbi:MULTISPECIES: Cys-Gln thioester bond-forming surface protein [Streptomyces]|uniref:Cys-Gln thioester bond-forming surface protein n=1 Tax=Streptomyces morookaense TaxID=1970 RepID=A0A7Y7B4V0_STRMO|nr:MULTISPECIES: Cys-Gln thioester bond-forming surface protein [Streptomyces]MCC2275435.1 Cys-Gln thioester bond-forming surface protein [Streptomyces sp. ET3-23]NVK78641.1 Cys-Gln thioester bond-forming surface protein [Streptomyces morookaense]GHF44411.1 TQXA domain-containing protein [Streptomyces morookaense]
MNSVTRRGAARLAAAVLASGLAVVGAVAAAGPAAAVRMPQNQGGVSAALGAITAGGRAVVHDRRKTGEVAAGLFEMKVDGGGALQTYCIDILTNTVDGAKYREAGWNESSLHDNKDAGKIRWILQHSYPQINDLAALAKDSGAGTLDANTAAAGTQVAIWRYSDHVSVDAQNPEAQKLADWLYKSAQDVEEPKASLTLGPSAVSGKSGQRLGPVTVHTDAASVTVAPSGDAAAKGVKIVGKDGKPVTTTADGGELYFSVPAGAPDGFTSLKVTAATKVPVGRAFIGDHIKTQALVLAGSSESTVSATATATWAKKGAAPAVAARKDCTKNGVEITVDNKGDEAFPFELAGSRHTVRPGGSETVVVKAGEDKAYRVAVTGANGYSRTFSGILDCQTAESGSTGSVGGAPPARPSPSPSPLADGDLATTGGSGSTPVVAGLAVVLIVAGGGAVYALRRREAAGGR